MTEEEREKLNKLYTWFRLNIGTEWQLEELPVPCIDEFKKLAFMYIDKAIHNPDMVQIEFSNDYKKIRIYASA